jgi:hypothetical protein
VRRDEHVRAATKLFAAQFSADLDRLLPALAHNSIANAPLTIAQVLQSPDVVAQWNKLVSSVWLNSAMDFAENTAEYLVGQGVRPLRSDYKTRYQQTIVNKADSYVAVRTQAILDATTRRIVASLTNTMTLRSRSESKSAPTTNKPLPIPLTYTFDDLSFDMSSIYDDLGLEAADFLAENETGQSSNYGMWGGAASLGVTMNKVWSAVLDKTTRDWHAEMDGVSVGLDEAFDVDGEQMMYPMDDSMGATARNIYNCRCLVYYETEDSDQEE